MRIWTRIVLCLLVAGTVSARGMAQEMAEVTITVPEKGHEETEVKVYSKTEFAGSKKETIKGKDKKTETVYAKTLKGEGDTRVFKVALEKEQTFKIVADIQPNNYTHIFRTKVITLKEGGKAKLDFTARDPKELIEVRYYPTPDDIVDKMSEMAKITKKDIVYDLGCGDARMLIRPIQKLGAKKGVGIEIDPKMVKEAKDNVKKAKLEEQIEIRQGDILDVKDLSDANVILLYIGDDLGARLSPVLQRTLKPGARVVSHRFSLGDWQPTKTIKVKGEDGDEYTLHLWIVKEKKVEKQDQ